MKHLPNLLTLLNLFFGCCAIVCTLTAYPYINVEHGVIQGMSGMQTASLFIGLAALMDLLDGLVARMLNAHSTIGKDLDSLADVVSFGVAPGVIMYQLLWNAYMLEEGALQTPFWVMAPAFLIPCFAAYRLAKFNQTSGAQTFSFIGMPVPAVGILVAALPLVLYNNFSILGKYLENRWILYGILALSCYCMVSTRRFLKWNTGGNSLSGLWPQLLIIIAVIASSFFLNYGAIVIGVALYILFSLLYPYNKAEQSAGS